jgi:D-alanyl-D-alanine dipeptidase
MNNFIPLVDPKVLSIAVIEQNDTIIDLKEQNTILYGPSPEIPNNQDYTKLRRTVYERLCLAQKCLPKALRFCIYEGYRSLQLQQYLFDQRFEQIRSFYPGWSGERIFKETARMVSPVINQDGSRNIPPHSTGGAIDIYLIDLQGNDIDMGIHPKDWMSDKDGSLSMTNSMVISNQAQEHRQIMYNVLEQTGFINYPAEYWHWSYGDKYWAYCTRNPIAIYGSLKE